MKADDQEDWLSLVYGYKKKDKEYEDCLRYSRTVKLYDVDYSDINIKNMKWLFYIFFAFIFVSFIVLLYEGRKKLMFITLLPTIFTSLQRMIQTN